MQIGYVLPNSWGFSDPAADLEMARLAEELGVDSLWVSHHVLHTGFVAERLGTGNYYDPLISLAAAATATRRVRLGTSVLVLGYLHPFGTAKQLATIDWLSHGRLDVGVGVGALRSEFDVLDIVPFADRGAYADEFIDVMRCLWAPGPTSHSGRWWSFSDVESYPGPYRRDGLPILIGGNGESALRRVAARGDGWHGLGLDPPGVVRLRRDLGARLAERGRDVEGFPLQLRLHVPADDLDARAWAARAKAYAQAGVTDLVLAPQSRDETAHRRWLEALVPVLLDAAGG